MVAEQTTSKCPRIYIVIDIIAPPQVYAPPLGGVQHPLAPEFLEAIRQRGPAPVALWKLINTLADTRQPDSRARRRCWRLRYWGACRELRKAKLLYRHGPLVCLSDFATRPKPRSQGRRPSRPRNSEVHLLPTVGALASKTGGSNRVTATPRTPRIDPQATEHELVAGNQTESVSSAEAKSAPPSVAEAAAALARRPRKVERPWTGYLAGERIKRGWLVQVPSGEVLPVYIALRSKIFVALPDEPRYADRVFDRYDADQVRRVKMPEAQLLGSLKAGIKERPSLRKQEAARANGRRPVRAGRRPRGRPRRSSISLGSDGAGFTRPTGDG